MMNRCARCGKLCDYSYLLCSDHGGPMLNDWRDSFSTQQKLHIKMSEYYVKDLNHFHGDMHLNLLMISSMAKIIDEKTSE